MSVSIAKNIVIMYFSLYLIANKTLKLVHENAPECTILKYKKKSKIFWGGGIAVAITPAVVAV